MKILQNRKFLFIFLVFYYFLGIKAQENLNYFSISKITQDDGLSQGSNYFRFEDSKGFMWITGNDALNRYDGSSVKVYNLKEFFKNCPTLQQGYGFTEDDNYLYVGSTRGLYRYDYKKDEFTLIEIFKKSKTKTAMPIGFSGGKIWRFNEDWELASYDTKSKTVKHETKIPLNPIKSVHVYDNEGNIFYWRFPFIDTDSNICFTGKENVVLYNFKTKKTSLPLEKFPEFRNTVFVSCAYDKANNQTFFGTENNGILVLKNQYKKIQNIFKEDKNISCIAVGNDKIIYRIEKTGIFILNKTLKKIKILKNGYERSYVFGFDKIGRLWYCDDGQGQIILNFNGTLLKNSNDIRNENANNFSAFGINNFAEIPDGNIFVHGVTFNPKNYSVKGFKNYKINSLAFSDIEKKQLWVYRYLSNDYSKLEFELIDKNQNTIKKIYFNGNFKHMQTFSDNFPMISSTEGLFWMNTEKKTYEEITNLKIASPFYISKISNNRVIISSLKGDAVLAKIEPKGKTTFLQNVLPRIQSFYFQEDEKKNQFWVGSNEGVYLLDKNFKIIKKFDSNNGLSGTYIYGIILDDFGKVWCSHQRGLSSIDAKNYSIINFDKEDGIQHWDFNNRAFYKTSEGTLFFGGVNGFNFFKPPLKFNSFYKPEIYLDEILVNGKSYKSEKSINQLSEISLKSDENDISIKALIKDLEYGKQRNLYYRITNINNQWKSIPKKTPLLLTNLASGNYNLEFGYSDKFNQKIILQKIITIQIDKKFYETFWFWALLGGLFFGGIIYGYFQINLRKQKRKLLENSALEAQRNKITEDLHDDIGATLSSLQINSTIASELLKKEKISEAQNVLSDIEIQSQKLSENMSDIVWSLRPTEDALMTLSMRIRNFANEILGNTNIDYSIEIDEKVDTEITDFTVRKNIVLITKEALNNAAKYSKASEIQLTFTKPKDVFELQIDDNGIGFDPDEKRGNGLQNMKKRALEIGGNFKIENKNGTSVKLSIPKFRD